MRLVPSDVARHIEEFDLLVTEGILHRADVISMQGIIIVESARHQIRRATLVGQASRQLHSPVHADGNKFKGPEFSAGPDFLQLCRRRVPIHQ